MEKQERAFRELKEKFTKDPVLAAPDLDKKIRMEVDVSDYVTGGVLSIEGEDGLWRLVGFLSKSLNKTERNYEIYNKEMLVIIRNPMSEDRSRGKCFLERVESILTGRVKLPKNVLLGKACQWNDNVRVVEDEPVIKVCKT